jgi:hypothetical protein
MNKNEALTTRLDLIYRCCGLSKSDQQRRLRTKVNAIVEGPNIRIVFDQVAIDFNRREANSIWIGTENDHRQVNLIERRHKGLVR